MNTAEENRKERETEARRREQRITNAYHRAFATEDGQAVLEDLAAVSRLEGRVFTPLKKDHHFAYDPLTAALADGGRAVLIYIRERLASRVQGDANLENNPEKVIKP
jgi:hypothetical protein